VNNVLVDDIPNSSISNSTNAKTPSDGTGNFAIGSLPDGTNGIYGQLDEVRFFNYEITAAEVKNMYEQTASCTNECFTEQFANNENWYLTQLNSTEPTLEVAPTRLRLTQNLQNQSASITFKRSFPALGNKMVIEFDHYAYGGGGADGIGVVLSDANVTPKPGSYGGSLGYAQRTNVSPSQPGFAGGWLGVGFDEFGNFSQASEGRVGGTSSSPNSVGVRAAASTNYGWMGGTSTLSPGLTSNSFGRGDRYRITVDSRQTSPQTVAFSLERRLYGSTTYTTLLSEPDLLALGQPTPPENFLLSYTGSTGDVTNIHEITNIQVCTSKPSEVIEIGDDEVDHYELSYASNALTCNPGEVTIKACASADCSTLYANPVTVQLAASDGSWVGGNSVTFTGSITKTLRKNTAGTTTLSISASSVGVANPLQCYEGGLADNCQWSFADSGFAFDVTDMVANQPQNVLIRAVKKDDVTKACVPGFSDVVKSVQFWSDYQVPDTGNRAVSLNGYNVGLSSASPLSLNLAFDSNGQSSVTLNYTDAGQLELHARYDGAGADEGLTMVGSDQFVSRPAGLCIVEGNGTATPNSCDSPYANCAAYKRAGDSFNLSITAHAAPSDSDGNVCNDPTTPNFQLSNIALSQNLIAPASGDAGALSADSYDHQRSVDATTTVAESISEVGVFTITATAATNSYFGYTIPAATSQPIGRFIPAFFTASSNVSELAAQCGDFTYFGKLINYGTGSEPQFTITANNSQGNVTKNYGGEFFKAADWNRVAATANSSYASVEAPSAQAGTRGTFTVANHLDYDGIFSLNLESDTVVFARSLFTPHPAPVTPHDLTLTLPASQWADSDAVCIKSSASESCQDLSMLVASPNLRYGRLAVIGGNAESAPAEVPVIVQTEYWTGTHFIVNTDDSCTVVKTSPTAGTEGLYLSGSAQADGLTLDNGEYTLLNGQSSATQFKVLSPGEGVWPVFYMAPTWLQYNWLNDDAHIADDSQADISVGRYRGNKRQIFWQERFN